jgi:hypothetical protein
MFFFSQQFFREVLGLAADFPVFPREIFACGANQRNSAFPHFPHRSGVYKTVADKHEWYGVWLYA